MTRTWNFRCMRNPALQYLMLWEELDDGKTVKMGGGGGVGGSGRGEGGLGFHTALFYCADVALGYCSAVVSLLPLLRFFLTFLPPSLSFFSLKPHNLSLFHFSQRTAACSVFSHYISLNSAWWDLLGLHYFTVQKYKTVNLVTKTTRFQIYCDWFPCSLNIYIYYMENWAVMWFGDAEKRTK